MGLFDFLRKRKNKKITSTSSKSADEEDEYLLKAEDDDNPQKVRKTLKDGNKQIEKGPDLDYYRRQIQVEMHLKDYRRLASLYHEIGDYTNELNMLLLYVETEKEKGNFYFALEYLNKAKNVLNSYCKDKNDTEIRRIKSRINKLEPYLKSKKELSDKLFDSFRN